MRFLLLLILSSCSLIFGDEAILVKRPQKPSQVTKKLKERCYEQLGEIVRITPDIINVNVRMQTMICQEVEMVKYTGAIIKSISDLQRICMSEIQNVLEEKHKGIAQLSKDHLEKALSLCDTIRTDFSRLTCELSAWEKGDLSKKSRQVFLAKGQMLKGIHANLAKAVESLELLLCNE